MVDLHIHTNVHSDAFTSPEGIVSIAVANGLSAIAITDHRSVKAIASAMKFGKELGMEVIPGIEIHAVYNKTMIHITGLFIDPTESSLLDFLSELDIEHEKYHTINNRLFVGILAGMGFPLTIEQIAYLVDLNKASGTFLVNFLEEQGMINANDDKKRQEIIAKLKSCNYYKYKNMNPQVTEVISYIHKAGGLAVLAHPLEYKMDWDDIDNMLAHLKSCGLDGVEVYYYNHDESQQNKLLELAKKYNLLRSGGSDFHGYEKQDGRDIGKGLYGSLVPDEALEEMRMLIKKNNQDGDEINNSITLRSKKDFTLYEKKMQVEGNDALHYRILLPEKMKEDEKYPLFMFFHGRGEHGYDNEKQLMHCAYKFLDEDIRKTYPSFVIFPQIALDLSPSAANAIFAADETSRLYWINNLQVKMAMELIRKMVLNSQADSDRIYIGGLSMGGIITYAMLSTYSDWFAAAVPICGRTSIQSVASWANKVPAWLFVGDQDTPFIDHNREVDKLLTEMKAGHKYTEYPDVGHNSWDLAFREPELFPWIYSNVKRNNLNAFKNK